MSNKSGTQSVSFIPQNLVAIVGFLIELGPILIQLNEINPKAWIKCNCNKVLVTHEI